VRHNARLALGLSAIGLAVGVAITSCSSNNNSSGVQGRIVWPKDGDLWVYNLASKQQTRLTNLPGGSAALGATWSPDGKRIIYSQFGRRPNERSSGGDLMIMNADGSGARIFVERDAANTVLDSPQWAPSGRIYYTVRRVINGREAQSIVRQTEDGQPELLVDNAYNPAVSADESALIYMRITRAGQAMFKNNLASGGDDCELMSDQVFQYLSLPRISPDGKRVALGGSGEPNLQQPSGCGGDPRSGRAEAPLQPAVDLLALLQPDVAYAHGAPADVYSLNLDGSGLTRIADLKDDDPTVAWSPDGSKLTVLGIAALYLVDAKGGPPEKLLGQGNYGGLDWTK
jgi:Tol biopolymer transport system component